MRISIDNIKSIFTLSFITSVLYFCGYMSSDYYNKILGIKINYDALEIIKWGADFFIYSVIDFCSINIISTFGKDWLKFDFIIVIFLEIILLFFSWYINTTKSKCNGFLKILQKKCIFTCWSCIFFIVIISLSVHYLTFFIGKTDLDYMVFFKLDNLYVVYSYFIILNILNILNILFYNWKSIWEKYIKYILITPLLFLPALYGVYGRNYNFNYNKDNNKTSLLLESHNGNNYYLDRNKIIVNKRNYALYQYKYKILKDEELNLEVDRINYFDFIKDGYYEHNN